jgi:hypothetical protein
MDKRTTKRDVFAIPNSLLLSVFSSLTFLQPQTLTDVEELCSQHN